MKIFISYDYSNDGKYKNMLLAWDGNKKFDFNFHDTSADVSINSHDAGVIKRAISAKINESDIVICIIGNQTHKSKWVEWEINKTVDLKKPIVAVKLDTKFKSPNVIQNVGAKWAMTFDFESIKKAIELHHSQPSFTINKGAAGNPSTPPPPPWSY